MHSILAANCSGIRSRVMAWMKLSFSLFNASAIIATFSALNFSRDALPADTVVLAAGLSPEQGVYRAFQGRHPDLYLIGDARAAKSIMSAVWDAYEVARAI